MSKIRANWKSIPAACAVTALSSLALGAEPAGTGKDWPSYYGNDAAWSYSALDQINRDNVKNLLPAWTFATGEASLPSAPIVIDGVMYVIAQHDHVFALDAASGKPIWKYVYQKQRGKQESNLPTRGLSVGNGMVYFGTRNNHLVALDVKTGRLAWDSEIVAFEDCHCVVTHAPQLVKNKVIVGSIETVPGRGYIKAFDAKTGKLDWQFDTVPGAGQPGNSSWAGDSWKNGGGGAWAGGSYDPDLNLIYWGTGNPLPEFDGKARAGDDLYTSSLVALDADTGKLKWYLQEAPNDVYDRDAATEPVLVDATVNGRKMKLVVHAPKSGETYVIDRANGKLVSAWPNAEAMNWMSGVDKDGRPVGQVDENANPDAVVCPSVFGSRGPSHSAYSPKTGWWYSVSFEACQTHRLPKPGERGGVANPGQPPDNKPFTFVMAPGTSPNVSAFDPATGKREWTFDTTVPDLGSLLATGGDLIFSGDPFGNVWALDATNGKKLWSFYVGAGIASAPVTYSVGGRQYVEIAAGGGSAAAMLIDLLWPELKDQVPASASTVYVFALPQGSAEK